MAKQRASDIATVLELEEARQQLRDIAKEAAARERQLDEAAALATQARDQAVQHMEELKADVAKYQEAARSSHDNYARELQLHSEAETVRKQVQEVGVRSVTSCVLNLT